MYGNTRQKIPQTIDNQKHRMLSVRQRNLAFANCFYGATAIIGEKEIM